MTDAVIELGEVRSLAARLASIPKDFHREARRPLRAAGQTLLRDAQANASWSSRIPGSMSLRVNLSGRRPGIVVRASLRSAPHARVYEGILGGAFKHPLFGDREHWYPQTARPYLMPAVEAATERVVEEISRVVDEVHRKAGLT